MIVLILGKIAYIHLSSRAGGCKACQYKNTRSNTEEFINKSQEVHNNYYNYSEVKYVNSSVGVTIICPDHGKFTQMPITHIRGSKCPFCANQNRAYNKYYYKNKRTTLYYIKIKNIYKIGITTKTIQKRFGKLFGDITVLSEEVFIDGEIAFNKEQNILKEHHQHRMLDGSFIGGGGTECFLTDVLGLDVLT